MSFNLLTLGSGQNTSNLNLTAGGRSVAMIVLEGSGVCVVGTAGSNLPGYDIKSQDSLAMLRLSLLATSNGQTFTEVYGGPDGCAHFVVVGETTAGRLEGPCLFDRPTSFYKTKIDHVVVSAKDPLPVRYHGGSVNVTGGGFVQPFTLPLSIGCQEVSSPSLNNEAWAVFQRSLNSDVTKEELKNLVRRSRWEQLVGYKVTFPPIPRHATFTLSQTTPFLSGFNLSNNEGLQSVTISLSEAFDDGGIVDVSNINIFGGQILDVQRGSDILQGTLGEAIRANSQNPSNPNGFSEDDYYILLDHQCGLHSLSRGQDWFLLGSQGSSTASIQIRQGEGNTIIQEALGFNGNAIFLRRRDDEVGGVRDAFELAFEGTGNPLSLNFSVQVNPFRGRILRGFKGASLGFESLGEFISYSVARPSVAVKSTGNDASVIASKFANAGIVYTAIIVQDEPAKIALNGENIEIPTPSDQEGVAVNLDSAIDNLEGTVIDISAPFLEDPSEFCANLRTLINSDTATSFEKVTPAGGYDLLPGMKFENKEGAIQTVEFKYTHAGSQTSNVSTGPLYYQVGGFSDSQYVKRSETITRTSVIVSGSNDTGVFVVRVDGLGLYNAINSMLEPVYPGDRVEVRLLNVPIER